MTDTKNANTDTAVKPAPSRLFELVQRQYDGAWEVLIRKSRASLGMVNRTEVEASRRAAFTDQEWADFIRQPHFADPTIWVVTSVHNDKPSVDSILESLGTKRRTNKPDTPRRQRRSA